MGKGSVVILWSTMTRCYADIATLASPNVTCQHASLRHCHLQLDISKVRYREALYPEHRLKNEWVSVNHPVPCTLGICQEKHKKLRMLYSGSPERKMGDLSSASRKGWDHYVYEDNEAPLWVLISNHEDGYKQTVRKGKNVYYSPETLPSFFACLN